MALLTAVQILSTATTVTPVAVTTSDIIAQTDIPATGAFLRVINGGGSSITTTLVDPNPTPAGNTATAPGQTVPAASERTFRIRPEHVNPNTGYATVTHSSATSVTCTLVKP